MAEDSPVGEILREWRQNDDLPPVCPLLLLAAEFGLPPVLLLLASFIWLRQRLARLPALPPGADGGASRNRTFLLAVCDPYLAAAAVFSLINVDWSLPALGLPFFFLWAMTGVREEPAPLIAAAPDMAAGAAVQQMQPGRPDGQAAGQVQPPVAGASRPLISDSASRPFTFS
jgi:hypothetical protein